HRAVVFRAHCRGRRIFFAGGGELRAHPAGLRAAARTDLPGADDAQRQESRRCRRFYRPRADGRSASEARRSRASEQNREARAAAQTPRGNAREPGVAARRAARGPRLCPPRHAGAARGAEAFRRGCQLVRARRAVGQGRDRCDPAAGRAHPAARPHRRVLARAIHRGQDPRLRAQGGCLLRAGAVSFGRAAKKLLMYNEHFGFPESPFRVSPDSRFFFVNPCYEEAFATLRYGIDARKGFVIVTGEAGTGKTTLLKRLTHGLDSQVSAVCIFDPHLSFNQLLQTALSDLGVKSVGDDRLTMMRRLYDFLVEQLERDQVVALMVDEAQSLSIAMLEELRLLSNLETDTEKLLQIVL